MKHFSAIRIKTRLLISGVSIDPTIMGEDLGHMDAQLWIVVSAASLS